jgi:hypothetical protein
LRLAEVFCGFAGGFCGFADGFAALPMAFAALPPDVRKGSAFPDKGDSKKEGLRPLQKSNVEFVFHSALLQDICH